MNSIKSAYVRTRQAGFLGKHLMLDVYLLEGEFQGTPLRIVVADDGSTMQYIRSVAFPEGATISKKHRISAFKAQSLARSNADVVVVGANLLLSRSYTTLGYHLVPKWICVTLPANGEHPEAILGRLSSIVRHDIRRIVRRLENTGYTWETTTDPAWFEKFYYDMYKPYAELKYQKIVQLDSYSRVKRAFTKGGGIIIKRNGEDVGGAVFYINGQTMRNPYLGILNADQSVVKEGAIQGLYYYVMQIAHSRGCEVINYGSSRPFLSDGVLRFKLKWGMEVDYDDMTTAVLAIKTPHNSEAGLKFLAANPFFELIDGNLQVHHTEIRASEPAGPVLV